MCYDVTCQHSDCLQWAHRVVWSTVRSDVWQERLDAADRIIETMLRYKYINGTSEADYAMQSLLQWRREQKEALGRSDLAAGQGQGGGQAKKKKAKKKLGARKLLVGMGVNRQQQEQQGKQENDNGEGESRGVSRAV